jgi:hypothetical protein
VAAGRLQVLLPEVAGEATPLHLVCMHRAQVTPLVLQLRDFLRDKCVALLWVTFLQLVANGNHARVNQGVLSSILVETA